MPPTVSGLGDSLRSLRDVFGNRSLRRLQLAAAAAETSGWGYAIVLSVYAYDRGGAAAVGLVGVLTMVPAAVAAPFLAVLADRARRERVMVGAFAARALLLGTAAAVVWLDGPAALVYGIAVGGSILSRVAYPAQVALLPLLARTPQQLTAANVAMSQIDSVASVAGPALAGALLVLAEPTVGFAAAALGTGTAALLAGRIRVDAAATAEEPAEATTERARSELVAGFRTIATQPDLRLIVGLYTAQTLVAGALTVLVVVLSFRLLELGQAGVGWLNAALGVGGFAGALAALALLGRARLAADFRLGIVLWGLPIALTAIWLEPAVALVLLAVVGIGNTLVDVSAFTLLQRAVPDRVRGRVFGVLEGLSVGAIGAGAILAPPLLALLGERGALVAVGAGLPLLAAAAWRPLGAIDGRLAAREREHELLRSVPFLEVLPAATLEQLARTSQARELRDGEAVFAEGDESDAFYVVDAGEVVLELDGRPATRLGSGDFFGEAGLLHDLPRTETVRAVGDVRLLAVDRDEFVRAVTGYEPSMRRASLAIAARGASLRTRTGSF